jgi:hypothetical protein
MNSMTGSFKATITWLLLPAFLLIVAVERIPAAEQAASDAQLQEMKRLRKKAAHRKRRIIVDNDGNEVVYSLTEATPEAMLAARTTGLVGTQVDTIVYCTWSSGFSYFTHNTKVGQVFDATVKEPGGKKGFSLNKTRAFIDQGTDCLKIITDFCRKKGVEIFWSFRMNDTHDAWGGWYSPYLFPQLKKDHPDWLVASAKKRSKVGGWSAVDYGRPEIRDLAFRFIEEVCQHYDVDGVLLDFFRHAVYFKKHAWGHAVGQTELDQMTDLLQRVRAMADREGVKRGRPILVGVRTPDSVEYCKAMGLDIVRWMKDDLIDMHVVTGYFRLNSWATSVKLGHTYGVPVYPCLSETRIRDKAAATVRRSLDCYRARAANVWQAGGDGVFMFNYTNPTSPLWRQMGSLKTLAGLDKVYCTGARGVKVVNRWMVGGSRFVNRSPVSPETPRALTPGEPLTVELRVGEDLAKATGPDNPPDVTLQLRVKGPPDAKDLSVALNGTVLEKGAKAGAMLEFPVVPALVKQGINELQITLKSAIKAKASLEDLLLWVRYKKGTS